MIDREDYEELGCRDCKTERKIPVSRVLEKFDMLMAQKEFEQAKRHLDYWQSEAEAMCDQDGKLLIFNEKIGFFRRIGDRENAYKYCDFTLEEAEKLGDDCSQKGTSYLNIATAKKEFGDTDEAIRFYEKALKIYQETLAPTDVRLGGLYNNAAVTLMAKKDYLRARQMFDRALEIAQKHNRKGEEAITYCNVADLEFVSTGNKERTKEFLEKAKKLLDGTDEFASEKCKCVFDCYEKIL